jgi:trk system potassium uptake protein TrkA
VARHKFGVPHTISRINNPKNEVLFKKLGVDTTVSTTEAILGHIEEHVPTHPLTHLLSLEEKELEIVEIKVSPTSPALGKRVGDVPLPPGSLLLLVVGEDTPPRIPTDETVLRAGDRVMVALKPEHEEVLCAALAGR